MVQSGGHARLTVSDEFVDDIYYLHLRQETPATPGQDTKDPLLLPVAVGLLNENGAEVLPTTVLEMTDAAQTFTFEGLASKPIPSVLRNFSAPVIVIHDKTMAERAFLLAHDTDPFNRWDAGRTLSQDVLVRMVVEDVTPDTAFLDGLATALRDDTLDPAFRALVLRLPSEEDTAQALFDAGHTPDPTVINQAHETLKLHIAQHMQDTLTRVLR